MNCSLHIAYGSESGNAHSLSYNLKRDLSAFKPKYSELNDVTLNALNEDDLLLIITSTTGDGEAPDNANQFYRRLVQTKEQFNFNFAVFGLGDTRYDNFCGFSIVVDGLLARKGAKAISQRVDADVDYEDFFEQWSQAIIAVLKNEPSALEALQALHLQVNPNE